MAVAERRIPGGCAVDATCRIEQAEQTIRKGSDNQIDRARVTESSNPVPSRGESANHRFLTGGSDVRPKQSGTTKGARGPHLTGDANAWSNGNRQRGLPPPKRTSLRT